MRKLALSDEILMKVEKPARYIGNELNSIVKDKDNVDIRIAMCFPDVYEIGMSHLGIQILYDMFNKREDTWCERVYSPWPDLHKIMKEENSEATQEEIDAKVAEQAASVSKETEEYKKGMDPRQFDYIRSDIVITKLFDFLKSNNEMVKE